MGLWERPGERVWGRKKMERQQKLVRRDDISKVVILGVYNVYLVNVAY